MCEQTRRPFIVFSLCTQIWDSILPLACVLTYTIVYYGLVYFWIWGVKSLIRPKVNKYLDISDQHQQSGHSCGHQSHCEDSQQVVTLFLYRQWETSLMVNYTHSTLCIFSVGFVWWKEVSQLGALTDCFSVSHHQGKNTQCLWPCTTKGTHH